MQHFKAHLPDESATAAIGGALAGALAPGLTLYLHGDLGAGKTALTRAMLQAAGHAGKVKSPTYTLVEPYSLQIDGRTVSVFHFDLYRLASPEEFLDAGFREHFNADNICIVEWPEKAFPVLPMPDIKILLSIPDVGREIELQAFSAQGSQCLDRLQSAPNLPRQGSDAPS
ncbi:tRNA threonylcarbamoyladenosine biosynthesis protein TsaE [Noviherbaspirillum humi]|uniref:tRNA threonylcarbamoyladenosine biosynthesis protein TsaE n=1 Tax=Noviherbaspirillum humi TaxID=1688639 RepID=A0A239KAQ6_9BURK|nr:tRNA (adenosine(37)-N6)-threonylcarbamoyltransferase complex ATPase subunit type 1 TsaE [Noviherbaspirillum humi]SNT15155.1 tRNA threonylcarbamoyladenosine biosynthesis protein TsaE [Noviherbaspirillum humi]